MNPFNTTIDQQKLFNISTGKAASNTVYECLINIEDIGAKLHDKFISECNASAGRFAKSISKVKIMNFSADIDKRTVKSGYRVQEIKIQRDLFDRMLSLSMDYTIDLEKFR